MTMAPGLRPLQPMTTPLHCTHMCAFCWHCVDVDCDCKNSISIVCLDYAVVLRVWRHKKTKCGNGDRSRTTKSLGLPRRNEKKSEKKQVQDEIL